VSAVTPPVVHELRRREVLGDAEVHVTDAIARLTGERDPDVLLAIALAVRAPGHGHVCLELDRVLEVGLAAEGQEPVAVALPELDAWLAALTAGPAVRRAEDEGRVAPCVLDGHRLYLDRYWRYEQRLVAGLERLLETTPDDRDRDVVRDHLDRLFGPESDDGGAALQRRAAEVAASRSLTVLTGGPGTGKTTTVVRLLALLLQTAPAGDPPRLVLAAPTGKAAARMADAIRDEVGGLTTPPEIAAALRAAPTVTLHRLLGWRPGSPTRFRHDAGNPLPYDVVVVDEASMASLPIMAKLVDALADPARLVLVGDREQLVSVDAGAVLSDICGPQPGGAEGPASRSIVALTHYYRFGADSGIGAAARAIQRVDGDAGEVVALLRGERSEHDEAGGYDDVALVDPDPAGELALPAPVRAEVVARYRDAVRAAVDGAPPAEVLAAFERFRVLTALRRGPQGVEAMNRAIERWVAAEVPGYDLHRAAPVGRPLIVTRNDYQVQLFNGDVGVVVRDPDASDRPRVAFPTPDGGIRLLSPSRLPDTEPVFAMSVHRSQGSQFDRVVLVLPTVDSPLLSRELVYTGITRARAAVTVVASEAIVAAALRRTVQRASGLAERLWGPRRPYRGAT
jgi:exodeoxyribonuclease V alpha subunit